MEIFQATTEIFAGIGVGEVLKNLQSRKIIFITDSMMRKVGLAEKIENILKKEINQALLELSGYKELKMEGLDGAEDN